MTSVRCPEAILRESQKMITALYTGKSSGIGSNFIALIAIPPLTLMRYRNSFSPWREAMENLNGPFYDFVLLNIMVIFAFNKHIYGNYFEYAEEKKSDTC